MSSVFLILCFIGRCNCQIDVAYQPVAAASVERGSCTAVVGCTCMAINGAILRSQNHRRGFIVVAGRWQAGPEERWRSPVQRRPEKEAAVEAVHRHDTRLKKTAEVMGSG
jgi:hypothetical protein